MQSPFSIAILMLALAAGPAMAEAATPPANQEPQYDTATVTRVSGNGGTSERIVTVRVTSGSHTGSEVEVHQHLSGQAGFDLKVVAGDEVVLAEIPAPTGGPPQYEIADYQRARPTTILFVALGLLMLLIGGRRGIKTIGVLAFTGLAVIGVLLPVALKGASAMPVVVGLAFIIALVTTLLTSGVGRKSWAAVLGTTIAAVLAAICGFFAAHFTRLTGVASEEAVGAQAAAHASIDFMGLLVAGMVVGALGVTLDLALSISAAVDELAEANPDLERGVLLQAGLQVGRDLLSTSSNTLFLAYLGSFLPVLLAFGASGMSGARLWHQETLAAEAVTLCVGLVGLLVAVPLTALVAAIMQPQRR